MPKSKTLCIDLRWIDSSGVRRYIKGLLPGLVEHLRDNSIVGLGDRARLANFAWSQAGNLRLADCRAERYSVAEQTELPRAIPAGHLSPVVQRPRPAQDSPPSIFRLCRKHQAIQKHNASAGSISDDSSQDSHDLVIIGQSEGLITGESPFFFERVRQAGDRVQLTGFVSKDELLSLVSHVQELSMPSTYEGFGLPPLEAMAAGMPVAVARAGSLPKYATRPPSTSIQ